MRAVFRRNREQGALIAIAFILAVVSVIFIVSVVYLGQIYSQQTNSRVWHDRLYRLANDGYVESLSRINADPGLQSFAVAGSNAWGVYSASATLVLDLPNTLPSGADTVKMMTELERSVYLVISATLTVPTQLPQKSIEVRSYVSVADAGAYFAAFKNNGTIGRYANLPPDAKVYARNLVIVSSGAVENPTIGKIFFLNEAHDLDIKYPFPFNPTSLFDDGKEYPMFHTSDASDPAHLGKVNQLNSEPLFPQVSPTYLTYLKDVATSGPHNSFFSHNVVFPDDLVPLGWASGDDIYPPGCTSDDCLGPMDNAAWKNHVYYVEGNLTISGKVHGQIIFLATGTITVNGDLISDSLTGSDADSPNVVYPGCPSPCHADKTTNIGHEEASNAHQAILVTPSPFGILINNKISTSKTEIYPVPAGYDPTTPPWTHTLSLEAYLLAPNGSSTVTSTDQLGSSFIGALILSDNVNWGNYLIYPSGKGPEYMLSLSTRPPPYLPSFTKLQVWDEVYR
jgi:hypothetical protein